MARLSPILRTDDFPSTELSALRLDGVVYPLGDSYCVIDEVSDVRLRATSLVPVLSTRLIAARLSAAWVWGAIASAPARPQVCVAAHARRRPAATARVTVHEAVLTAADVVTVAGIGITTPRRTAIDIARFSLRFGTPEATCGALLMRLAGFSAAECIDEMERNRNLPNKIRAARRLRSAEQLLLGDLREEELSGADAIHVVDRVNPPYGIEHTVEVSGVAHLEDEPAERKAVA